MIIHAFIHLTEAVALLAGHMVDEPTDNFKLKAHTPSVYSISFTEISEFLHFESAYTAVVTVDDVAVMSAYLLSAILVQVFSA